MKHEIDLLLEKYFRGKTSLEDENKLKLYFNSDNIDSSHLIYADLFKLFKEEAEVQLSDDRKQIPLKPIRSKLSIKKYVVYSGIAAAIALLFLLVPLFNTDSYMVINGKKIEQPEHILQYTEAKFDNVHAILSRSLSQLEKIEKTKETINSSMEPIETVKKTINNLNEKITNKIIKYEKNDDISCMLPFYSSNKRTNA